MLFSPFRTLWLDGFLLMCTPFSINKTKTMSLVVSFSKFQVTHFLALRELKHSSFLNSDGVIHDAAFQKCLYVIWLFASSFLQIFQVCKQLVLLDILCSFVSADWHWCVPISIISTTFLISPLLLSPTIQLLLFLASLFPPSLVSLSPVSLVLFDLLLLWQELHNIHPSIGRIWKFDWKEKKSNCLLGLVTTQEQV